MMVSLIKTTTNPTKIQDSFINTTTRIGVGFRMIIRILVKKLIIHYSKVGLGFINF